MVVSWSIDIAHEHERLLVFSYVLAVKNIKHGLARIAKYAGKHLKSCSFALAVHPEFSFISEGRAPSMGSLSGKQV